MLAKKAIPDGVLVVGNPTKGKIAKYGGLLAIYAWAALGDFCVGNFLSESALCKVGNASSDNCIHPAFSAAVNK